MNQEFLKNIPKPILLKLGRINLAVPSKNAHEAIDELLSKTVLMGGKRLRPLLTYLFSDFVGLSLDRADVSAKAIEMVHAASLAHDDVIDEATQRRGQASINIQADNKRAVLAGDYLLAAVIGELCRQGNLDLVSEMAWVIEELASGEWVQADAVLSRQYTKEILEQIALKKTSSVMSWCAVAPVILAGHSEELKVASREFGHHLGLAFQYLDDTLDFSGESKKDTLLDLKNGQVNSVVFEWLVLNPEHKKAYEDGADIGAVFDSGSCLDEATEKVQAEAHYHLEECRKLLEAMKSQLKNFRSEKELIEAQKSINYILNYLGKRRS